MSRFVIARNLRIAFHSQSSHVKRIETRIEAANDTTVLNAVRFWILLSTLLVSSGWILSAFHQLNRAGYASVLGLAAVVWICWLWRTNRWPARVFWQPLFKFRRRFRRAAPLFFMVLAFLAFLGGLLYAPSDADSAAYRIPRVMHWLAAGQWHWIRTLDFRMNIASCGMEWTFAPLILLTRSDRFLFLPNLLSFLLLPGLIFTVFRRLGIAPRVAWWWMWLLPSGWCFIMQAGSTVNDSFAAVYALGAVAFGLRARESENIADAWLAMLSAALATGVKQTDIPLAIPGLIVLWANRQLLLRRWVVSSLVASVSLVVSVFPTVVLNFKNTGGLLGIPVGGAKGAELTSPFWGVIGNAFSLTVQNLKPPLFPFSGSWNGAMRHFLETSLGAHFRQFEAFGRLSFGVGESGATLGAGICILALASYFAAWRYGLNIKPPPATAQANSLSAVLRWTPWALVLMFMAKVGTFENGRQLASYYVFLLPSFLASPGQSVLIRRGWWKAISLSVAAMAVALLIVSRDRPLFPAQTLVGLAERDYPRSKLVSEMLATYAETPAFAKERTLLQGILPKGEGLLGYAAARDGELESSLWLPYGERRIVEVLPGDTAEQLHDLNYIVLEDGRLRNANETLPRWLAGYGATLVRQWGFLEDPHVPPRLFYLVRLRHLPGQGVSVPSVRSLKHQATPAG